jgi:hypothetical protein
MEWGWYQARACTCDETTGLEGAITSGNGETSEKSGAFLDPARRGSV